ncbi:tetratricopeptide repeat protein [Mucilaginibacter litoreus]|uniref:Tetratricopeptide repeat protein n=1 Tax=Mucilaginibacter litoreus TaxID=1048221 RepID=A0ABW3AQX8_9SPHI
MNNNDASKQLEQASEFEQAGNKEQAINLYNVIIKENPDWSVPYYNLGLLYKYQCDWKQSFHYNKKATELNSHNEAAWWNLGIAATAINNWVVAREAWNHFGLNLEISDSEPNLNLAKAPVRLNPDDDGEVVWCTRIDPARAIIDNIPLSSCGYRYRDLILNDGAPVGHRISEGIEYPVFNELQLLSRSSFRTYSTTVYTNDQQHINKLISLCEDVNIKVEDWSTIRILCKQCSESLPHKEHDNYLQEINSNSRYIYWLC